MADHIKNLEQSRARGKALKEGAPKVMGHFQAMHDEVCKDGTLPFKTKELAAIGIGVAIRCECCINHHVNLAVKAGATRAEVLEIIEVAVLMGGGPSTHYGAAALEAYDQISGAE